MAERLRCESREDWLSARFRGIGASEAAAAVGMIPAKDLSENAAVRQGNRMEPILRVFYAAIHPEYEVRHCPYDIIFQPERPWLFATLDGELAEDSGRYGILEIKTATPNGKAGWKKWADGNMPQNYYIQTLHQLLATGFEFVRLFAALYSMNGDITLREYEIERGDVQEDLDWLVEQESAFWKKVESGIMPAQPLML